MGGPREADQMGCIFLLGDTETRIYFQEMFCLNPMKLTTLVQSVVSMYHKIAKHFLRRQNRKQRGRSRREEEDKESEKNKKRAEREKICMFRD
jgi:hypothetical protein